MVYSICLGLQSLVIHMDDAQLAPACCTAWRRICARDEVIIRETEVGDEMFAPGHNPIFRSMKKLLRTVESALKVHLKIPFKR